VCWLITVTVVYVQIGGACVAVNTVNMNMNTVNAMCSVNRPTEIVTSSFIDYPNYKKNDLTHMRQNKFV